MIIMTDDMVFFFFPKNDFNSIMDKWSPRMTELLKEKELSDFFTFISRYIMVSQGSEK